MFGPDEIRVRVELGNENIFRARRPAGRRHAEYARTGIEIAGTCKITGDINIIRSIERNAIRTAETARRHEHRPNKISCAVELQHITTLYSDGEVVHAGTRIKICRALCKIAGAVGIALSVY